MTLKKMRFFWQNWFDTATVTASSEVADYPVEQLQNRWKKVDWRSEATYSGGEWIQAVFTIPRAIQGFILENMNLTTGATVTLTGDGNNIFTIAPTAEMVAEKRIVVVLASATPSYQTWLLSINDVGNPDAYLSASRIYLGPVFESDDHGSPWTRVRESGSEVSYSDGGQASAVKRPKFWIYDLPITILGQSDADAFAAIDDECGIDTPLWVCRDTTAGVASTVYGSFLVHTPFPSIISGALWETSLRFREEL